MQKNLWQTSSKNALQTTEYKGEHTVDLAIVGGRMAPCTWPILPPAWPI